MDRLTKRNENGGVDLTGKFSAERIYNFLRDNLSVLDAAEFQNILERLAYYEDADYQTRMLIIPCGDKIGKRVVIELESGRTMVLTEKEK